MERIARDYSSIEIVSSLDCVVLNSFYQTRHYLHLVGDRSVKGGVEIKPQEEIGVKTKFLGSSVRIQKLSDYCSEVEAKIPFVWESAEHARFLQEVTSPNFDYRNPHTIRKVVEYKGVQLEFWDGLGNVLVDSNYRTNNLCWYSAPFDLLTEDNLDQEKPHENLVDLNSNRDFCSYGESFLRFDNKYKFDNYIINLEIRTIIVFCDIWIRNTSVINFFDFCLLIAGDKDKNYNIDIILGKLRSFITACSLYLESDRAVLRELDFWTSSKGRFQYQAKFNLVLKLVTEAYQDCQLKRRVNLSLHQRKNL